MTPKQEQILRHLLKQRPIVPIISRMIGYPHAWWPSPPKSVTVDPWVYDLLEEAVWPMLRLTDVDLCNKGYENLYFRGVPVIRGAS